jgi:hypothetical protein
VRRLDRATIDYLLGHAGKQAVVEVLDASGTVIRKLEGKAGAGHHRVVWDLRHQGATVFPGMILRSSNPGQGPLAAPGRYQVRVTVDGVSRAQPLEVRPNPNLADVTARDLEEQFELARRIRDKTSAANEAVIRIRALRAQVEDRLARDGEAGLRAAAASFLQPLAEVEQELYQVRNRSPKDPLNYPIKLNNRLAVLSRVVESADARPTAQTYEVFDRLSRELDVLLRRLERSLSNELPELNRALARRGLGPVALEGVPE